MPVPHSGQDFVEPLRRLASAFETTLDAAIETSLCRYLGLVAEWNEKIDLTAARAPDAMAEVLVADAFVLARRTLVAEGAHLLDVGTGAGGPVVGLLLMRPDLRALLMEGQRKRVGFLRLLIDELGLGTRVMLDDVGINPKRPSIKRPVDIAMSRATFAPDLWLTIGTKVAPRTLVLAVQPDAPAVPKGAALEQTVTYALPFSGAPRAIHSVRRG